MSSRRSRASASSRSQRRRWARARYRCPRASAGRDAVGRTTGIRLRACQSSSASATLRHVEVPRTRRLEVREDECPLVVVKGFRCSQHEGARTYLRRPPPGPRILEAAARWPSRHTSPSDPAPDPLASAPSSSSSISASSQGVSKRNDPRRTDRSPACAARSPASDTRGSAGPRDRMAPPRHESEQR